MDNKFSYTIKTDGNAKVIFSWRKNREDDDNCSLEDPVSYPTTTCSTNVHSSIRTAITARSSNPAHTFQSDLNDFEVLWLDNNVNSNEDCLDTQTKLGILIQSSRIFSNSDECINYILSTEDRPVLLITSGSIGHYLIPLIYEISQIVRVYIFCDNLDNHIMWTQKYLKIHGIFNDKDALFSKLTQDLESFSISSSILSSSNVRDIRNETSVKNLEAEPQSFIWYQLILEAILRMEETPDEKTEMIEECKKHYANDKIEHAKIIEFENSFTPNNAIQWYTRDSFLYRLFNKALRTQDVAFIYKFRFFLKNLYNQLAQVYNKKTVHSQSIPEVYRGQMLRIEELQWLKDSIGGIISFHTFLSATRDINVALIFAGNGKGRPFFESVVFCIRIFWEFSTYIETTLRVMNYAGIDAKPFADISSYAYNRGEQEILFAMGSVFEILSIKLIDTVWYVTCKFYPGGNGNFLKDEISSWNLTLVYNPRVDVLGDFLLELGDYDTAINFYVMSAIDQSDDLAVAWAHYKLGRLYMRKGDCSTAFSHLQKAESLMLLNVSPTNDWLKNIFETIGDTHMIHGQQQSRSSREYELALLQYKKALNTVTTQNSNEDDRCSSNFKASTSIRGSADEDIICAELYYKISKAYHSMGDDLNAELFAEASLTILKSNDRYHYSTLNEKSRRVAAVGMDSREVNTLAVRQLLFNRAIYIVDGAIIPDSREMIKRFREFVQLTNDKDKKLICCKYAADMCIPFYPNLYDILLFCHEYSLQVGSEYEEDYSHFFMHQENILGIDSSNMPLSAKGHSRNCIALVYMESMLKERLNYEDPDEVFLTQMMDFHIAMWIKRRDLKIATMKPIQLENSVDLLFCYNEDSILAKNYSCQRGALASINTADQALHLYQKQLEILLKTNQNKASLAGPYRNIGRIYSNICEYTKALENFDKCLAIAHTCMLSNESFLARTYAMIGNTIVELYMVNNAFSDAMNLMKMCLGFLQKYAASDYSKLASTYARLAYICYTQGDYHLCLEYTTQELVHLHSANIPDCGRVRKCEEKINDVKKKLHSHNVTNWSTSST